MILESNRLNLEGHQLDCADINLSLSTNRATLSTNKAALANHQTSKLALLMNLVRSATQLAHSWKSTNMLRLDYWFRGDRDSAVRESGGILALWEIPQVFGPLHLRYDYYDVRICYLGCFLSPRVATCKMDTLELGWDNIDRSLDETTSEWYQTFSTTNITSLECMRIACLMFCWRSWYA
jgi:hypothetical protein